MSQKVIIDTDWGGDALQVLAVLLNHPDQFDIIGATTVFGNTSHELALRNCGDILHFIGADHIPYFPGAEKPRNHDTGPGDGAHGADGIGGVVLEKTPVPPQQQTASDFILNTLKNEPEQSVTIIAIGPQTNMALAFQQSPDIMKRVKNILIMGGCTQEMKATDMPMRQGNIEPDAEFNFNQAPQDAATVLNSGLPITLFPMNCTHQLTVTPKRQEMIRTAFQDKPELGKKIIGLMTAPAEIDMRKFGISPVMHDVHTALYLLHPEEYTGQKGYVEIGKNGRSDFREDPHGPVMVMNRIQTPNLLFQTVLKGLTARFL